MRYPNIKIKKSIIVKLIILKINILNIETPNMIKYPIKHIAELI